MKITLAKLTAFSLLAAAASAEGEAVKKDLPALRGAIQLAVDATDSVSAISADENAFSDKTLASSDSKDLFPDEMNEESRRRRDDDDDDDDSSSRGKPNAAQKRQSQRDKRRSYNNPSRSQREEQNERDRKNRHSRNRGNRCSDPSEPGCGNDNYPRNREAQRNQRCNGKGRSCNYHRVNPDDEPNGRRRGRDRDCLRDCDSEDSRSAREKCERKCSAFAQE